jgi:hypothetical protein
MEYRHLSAYGNKHQFVVETFHHDKVKKVAHAVNRHIPCLEHSDFIVLHYE